MPGFSRGRPFSAARNEFEKVRLVKNLIVLMVIGALAAYFVSGCGGEPRIEIEPTEIIETRLNQEFTLSRGYDLNSLYAWREDHDESMIELVDTAIGSTERDDGSIVLSQDFRFKAIKKGKTVINLIHVRYATDGLKIAQQDFILIDIK